jgi:hypothetical protein
VEKMFEAKFDIRKEGEITTVNRVSAEAKNYFTSPYEYLSPQSSIFSKMGKTVFKLFGGLFSFAELLPKAKIEITAERYTIAKVAYLQPLKKASRELEVQK